MNYFHKSFRKISHLLQESFILKNLLRIILIILVAAWNGCGPVPVSKQISGPRYLIVNGDDLCMDERTDEAIVSAYRNGILTSTTAFINLQGSVENLKKIHSEYPDLPIGIHLNLTFGGPVSEPSEVAGITDTKGMFYDITKILKHLPDMPLEEVKKEFNAQVELFVSTGVPLDHIDYHHHLPALYTPFFEIVREIALKHDVPVRNPVPASIYNLVSTDKKGGGGSASMRKLILFGITHPFKSIPMMSKVGPDAFIEQENLMFAEGIKSTDWFIDSFYENATADNLISILNQLPCGVSELMCHPGMNNELEVLTDKSLKTIIDSLDIQMVSWAYLKQQN